ncbi:MAG: hypothetical protein ABIV25_13310, partial [Paracoccaceae bacterium]
MRNTTLALILLATPTWAADQPNLDPAAPAIPGAVALLLSAQNLYALGQSGNDPLMVLTAARMMRGVALIPTDRTPQTKGTPAPFTLTLPDAPAMLTTARALATGDDLLPDLIESIASEVPPQPKSLRATPSQLAPGLTDTWTLPFYGGTYGELAIIGAGQGNLDLSVTDDKGNRICEDNGSADTATCGFTPKDNGDFTVIITNSGTTPDAYLLVT